MRLALANSDGLGAIRQTVVNISDTVYLPSQVPSLLSEMLECIVDKVRRIKNPIEEAFFLWVNIAYLQPFEDGNKRTSRLSANIPLMLYNCSPLSFMDVDRQDYAQAIDLIVRERKPVDATLLELRLTEDQAPGFADLLRDELLKLGTFNCARYRLTMNATSAWIEAGRPS